MRRVIFAMLPVLVGAAPRPARAAAPVHVWQKQEITLQAQGAYGNPYLEVDVWVDLRGPGFRKRVYGFWDGGKTFRVRVLATEPGRWSWTSGSNVADPGLNGRKGSFVAVPWSEAEKAENLCRRGFVRPTANGHAFQLSDGTPFLLLGDTWWAAATFRYAWTEDDRPHPIGPQATFKDLVRYRKAQGFNSVALIAAFPSWANDGKPLRISLGDADKTLVRSAWDQPGTSSAREMHNTGGRPFLFPGRVPGQWESAAQVNHLQTFALAQGKRYQDLEPNADLLSPHQSREVRSYEGWAYCARTPERDFFLIYLEKGCPRTLLRGAASMGRYQARWFNPRNGQWVAAGDGTVDTDFLGRVQLPPPPSDEDWGLSLVLASIPVGEKRE